MKVVKVKSEVVKRVEEDVDAFVLTPTERMVLAEALTKSYRFSTINNIVRGDDGTLPDRYQQSDADFYQLYNNLTDCLNFTDQDIIVTAVKPARFESAGRGY